MDFVRRFAACTPQSASVVAGLACALIMMEVQRMPVAHSVSFSMFAPVPYLAEAFALMVLAFLVWRYPARRLSNSAILRGAVGFLATLSTWLVLWGTGLDETLMFVVRAVYRASTGLLVVLWAERLMGLGSWREGCLIAAAIIVSGALTCLLSVVPANVLEGILVLLPLVAAGAFLTYRGRPGDGSSSALPSISPAEHHPLPAFSLETTRDIVAAAGLLAFPLLCRSPMISTQSAWMPLQDGFTMDQAMQLSIGAGTILGGVAVALIIRFAWNRSFVLVLDLLVLPLSLVSLYTASAGRYAVRASFPYCGLHLQGCPVLYHDGAVFVSRDAKGPALGGAPLCFLCLYDCHARSFLGSSFPAARIALRYVGGSSGAAVLCWSSLARFAVGASPDDSAGTIARGDAFASERCVRNVPSRAASRHRSGLQRFGRPLRADAARAGNIPALGSELPGALYR